MRVFSQDVTTDAVEATTAAEVAGFEPVPAFPLRVDVDVSKLTCSEALALATPEKVLYLEYLEVSDDEIADALVDLSEDERSDRRRTASDAPALAAFRFAYCARDGQFHEWARESEFWHRWFADAEVAAECAVERRAADEERERHEQLPAFADELSRSAEFRRSPVPSRRSVCRERFPSLIGRELELVVAEAVSLMDAALAPAAQDLHAQGQSKSAIVATLGITRPALDRYLSASTTPPG